jgi:hypothetical protein
MGDWDDERGRRTSALGRVDWSCWLAAVGLLFVTVISVVVKFPAIGIVTAVLAVLLVVFDSWVNRPKAPRAARRTAGRDPRWETGWSDVRRTGASRPQPAVRQQPAQRSAQRRPQPDYRTRQAQQHRQPPQRTTGQPYSAGRAQPQRAGGNQAPRPNVGQPPRPNRTQQGGQPGRGVPNGQSTRANQGQPPRPAYRPTQEPARGREPDYRART